jgi:dTDP-4-dehydrorhamnose reductase
MTSILLIGAAGQLGRELQRKLPCVGTLTSLDRERLDLTQPDRIYQAVYECKPDVIVNAAAYTAVDQAEREPNLAHAINSEAPTTLAEIANRIGASLVHVSTDYVFDGQAHTPYLETAPTGPISAYGRSKLAGEIGIRQACDRHIILRTAWVYGTWGKSNFVKTMLRLGSDRPEIRVVADQVGVPTWAADLAQAIAVLTSRCVASDSLMSGGLRAASSNGNGSLREPFWGTYHFTNSGVASWYDFSVAIFEIARQLGFPLQVQRVVPISTAEYPTPAQRPAYSVLSLKKSVAVLGGYPPHWRQSLKKMLAELYTQSYESSYSLRR